MRAGALLALIVVVAFLGFELYTLTRLSYRTEPLYIYDQWLRADAAFERCGSGDHSERKAFLRNLSAVRRRAADALADELPGDDDAARDLRLEQRAAQQRQAVLNVVTAGGCGDKQVWRWLKTHEQRARLNLG